MHELQFVLYYVRACAHSLWAFHAVLIRMFFVLSTTTTTTSLACYIKLWKRKIETNKRIPQHEIIKKTTTTKTTEQPSQANKPTKYEILTWSEYICTHFKHFIHPIKYSYCDMKKKTRTNETNERTSERVSTTHTNISIYINRTLK